MKFDIGDFFNVCEENRYLMNIRQKHWALHMKAKNILLPVTSVPQKHCCKTLSIFIMLEVTGCSTAHKEHSAVFPLPQWLYKHGQYIAHLV